MDIKYPEIVASAIILHNAVDMTIAINKLLNEGYKILRSDIESMSPYITRNIKRFGDYHIDINVIPNPIQQEVLIF